jgi:uncharacterized protein (DUF58 family)
MLTRTGKITLVTSAVLYLIGAHAASSLVFLILGMVLGLFVINFVEARRAAARARVRAPASITCFEGDHLTQAWGITNPAAHSLGLVTVKGDFGTLLTLPRVPPRSTVYQTPRLCFARRGVISFHDLTVQSTYPFGLIKRAKRLRLDGEIVVYPRPYPCAPPLIAGYEPVVDGLVTGKNFSRSGYHFHSVRPLRDGDPLKLIHWKSSAKGQGLMVKEFDETLSGRLGLIVVPGVNSQGGPARRADENKDRLDAMARAAASLMLSALDQGHQVEYVQAGPTPHARFSVPPFANGEPVLDALARLNANESAVTLTPEQIQAAVFALPVRASLCLVMPGCTPRLRGWIGTWAAQSRRKVMVCLPNTTPIADRPTAVPVRVYAGHSMKEGDT